LPPLTLKQGIEFCEGFVLLCGQILKEIFKRGILNLGCKISATLFVFRGVIQDILDIQKLFWGHFGNTSFLLGMLLFFPSDTHGYSIK
jgi:hypothetical protein